MDYTTPEVNGYTTPEVEPVKRTSWNKEAATSYAAKVSRASGGLNPEEQREIVDQLVATGESSRVEEIKSLLKQQDAEVKLEAASSLVPELGAHLAAKTAQEALQEPTDGDELVEEAAIAATVAASAPDSFSPESYATLLDEERSVRSEYIGQRSKFEPFTDSALENIHNFISMMVPFNEANSWRKLANDLQDRFGEDFGSGAKTIFLQGEVSTAVRDWFTNLDSDEQLEAMQYLSEVAPDYAGFFGENELIAASMISTIVEGTEGGYFEGDFDATRLADNIFSILDFGGSALSGVKLASRGVKRITSNAASLERTSPKEAALLEAEALAAGEEVAQPLGVSRDEIVADNYMPKWESYEDSPHISNKFFDEQVKLVEEVTNRGSELDLHMTDAEKAVQAGKLKESIGKTKRAELWENASKITPTDEGLHVTARFGADAERGFDSAEEAADALKWMQQRNPDMKGTVTAKTHGGKTLDLTPNAPIKGVDLTRIRARLLEEAGGAMERGATVRGKTSGKAYRADQRQADRMEKVLDHLRGGEAADPSIAREAQRIIDANSGGTKRLEKTAKKKAIKDVSDELTSIKARLAKVDAGSAQQSAAMEAKANLERFDAGQYDELTGSAKKAVEEELAKGKVVPDGTALRPAEQYDTNQYFIDLEYTSTYKTDAKYFDFNMDDIHWRGDAAAYFADISAGLARHLSDSFYRAFDSSRASERMMNDILKPFIKAKNANKKRILALLDEGSKYEMPDGSIGKDFTHDELLARLPTGIKAKDAKQVIEGYLAVRMMADAAHSVMNKALRESLDGQGYKHLKVGDFETVGVRATDEAMDQVKAYYDPTTGQVVEGITPATMRQLREEGAQIFNVKGLHGEGGSVTNNVLVRSGDSVAELPQQVMNYRPGYIPRMYKEQYFVTIAPNAKKINGVTVTGRDVPAQTVAAAKSKKAVMRMVEEMREKNPDMVVDWKHDRSLTAEGARASELELHMNTNGLFYSKRGEHLARESGELAETEDAVSSIARMAASVSRRIELSPVIDLHKQRWLSRFGHLTDGKWPNAKDVISDPARMTSDEVKAARSYWDYINLQEAGGTTSEWWRKAMINFGEFVEGKTGMESLGSFFRTSVADNDPLSLVRGSVFISMIVLNPFRQLFIQSQQAFYLAGLDPKNFANGRVYGIGMNLLLPGDRGARTAKALGMTPVELDRLKMQFKESGLVEAVDSNLIGRDATLSIAADVTNGPLARASQALGNTARRATNAVRTAGFDAGEMLNLSTTYSVAYLRWKRLNPGKDPFTRQAAYEIAADTRQLALGMTQAGSYKYQRGILSLPMQFLSVQHKALMAMLPAISKSGNKAISKTEARRIVAGQFLLYGATGIGLGAVVDNLLEETGVQLSPDARNLLIGGGYDYLANKVLNASTDSDTNLAFSSSLAAGGGWYDTILDKIDEIFTSPSAELFAGPSGTLYSRVGYAAGLTSHAVGAWALGEGKVDLTEEDVIDMINGWGSIFSMYNNVYRATAMHKTQSFVDSNFTPVGISASTKDAFVRAVLGVGTYEEEGRYDHIQRMMGIKEKYEDLAKVWYKRISRSMATENKLDTFTPMQYQKMLRLMSKEYVALQTLYGDEDARQIMFSVGDLIRRRDDQGDGALAKHIADLAMKGGAGDSMKQIVTNGVNSGILSPEEADVMMKLDTYLFAEQEEE